MLHGVQQVQQTTKEGKLPGIPTIGRRFIWSNCIRCVHEPAPLGRISIGQGSVSDYVSRFTTGSFILELGARQFRFIKKKGTTWGSETWTGHSKELRRPLFPLFSSPLRAHTPRSARLRIGKHSRS